MEELVFILGQTIQALAVALYGVEDGFPHRTQREKKKKHFPRCRTIPSTSKDRFCYNTVFLNDRSRRSKISTLPSTKNKPVFLSTTAVTDRVYTTPPK